MIFIATGSLVVCPMLSACKPLFSGLRWIALKNKKFLNPSTTQMSLLIRNEIPLGVISILTAIIESETFPYFRIKDIFIVFKHEMAGKAE